MTWELNCSKFRMRQRLLPLLFIAFTAGFSGASELHPAVSASLLTTIDYPIPAPHQPSFGTLVFGSDAAWIGTPGGLYRAPLRIDASLPELVAFPGLTITDLAVTPESLYLTRERAESRGAPATDHGVFRSDDDGLTWTPLDGALEECLGEYCAFLFATEIAIEGDRIFMNAGGNVIVSGDEGASWSLLFGASNNGEIASQACYHPTFELTGRRLFIGGECPLDISFLIAGELDEAGLEWAVPPGTVQLPNLENRNIQFIHHRADTEEIYSGIEGALLRSQDLGESFDFILRYTGDDPKYPYIGSMLIPSARPQTIIAGGFDKAGGGPWLAVSFDKGGVWSDVSGLLPVSGHPEDVVLFIEEDPFGRIIIGLDDAGAHRLSIFELKFETFPRRRAIRPR